MMLSNKMIVWLLDDPFNILLFPKGRGLPSTLKPNQSVNP